MIRPDGQASWRSKTKPKTPGIRVKIACKDVDDDHRVVDDGTSGRCCVDWGPLLG
jgi:hypothetical protein